MEEKELQELERALRAAAPNLPWESLPEWHPYDRLKIAAVNAIPSLLSDIREARRLLGEARDHLRSEHQCASNEPTDIDAFLGERHGKD